MSDPLVTLDLGKRYGATWALRDCSFTLPAGRVAALVGPNGAGKTTLLHLCVGLLAPTTGKVAVFDHTPYAQPADVLPRVGFLAQDHPLYKGFTVAETLTLGRKLNPRWDDAAARARLQRLAIPLDRRIGKLSGGQQAQVALALALSKRPELLLLDEPVASLDPLARRDFLRTLTDAATEDGLSVLLSSHIIGDLERVCDYLIILSAARVQLAGDIEEIAAAHKLVTVPRGAIAGMAATCDVIEETPAGAGRAMLLVRRRAPDTMLDEPSWDVRDATMEAIVLAYLGQPAAGASSYVPQSVSQPALPVPEPLARGGKGLTR